MTSPIEVQEGLDADDPIAFAIEQECRSWMVDQACDDGDGGCFVHGALERRSAEFDGMLREADPMRATHGRL
jgi:hypothetical protein